VCMCICSMHYAMHALRVGNVRMFMCMCVYVSLYVCIYMCVCSVYIACMMQCVV